MKKVGEKHQQIWLPYGSTLSALTYLQLSVSSGRTLWHQVTSYVGTLQSLVE